MPEAPPPRDKARTEALDTLATAFCVANCAIRDATRRCFRAVRHRVDVFVHPSSVLHGRNPAPDALVYASSVQTTKLFLRGVLAVDAAALPRLCPRLFATGLG